MALSKLLQSSREGPLLRSYPIDKYLFFLYYYPKEKLTFWHKLNIKKIKFLRNLKVKPKEEKLFLLNLVKIGYSKIKKNDYRKNQIYLIKAFQRRFRQELINGKVDKECLLISKNLIKS